MKTVGIIAEYNPFHNGHAYQIAEAKKITGADYCVVIMSGNFMQRGIPAIMDKSLRIQSALMCGADLVLELPVHYATGSAEYFASGAIAMLDRLNVIDCLCFGSECGNIQALSMLSDSLVSESEEFKDLIKQNMKAGSSYPKARNNALIASSPRLAGYSDILQFPNNILGIEYLKALKKRGSHIEPYTISRKGSDYHDDSINDSYSSALAIRESIEMNQDISLIKEQLPEIVYKLLEENYLKTFPITIEDFSSLILYKLIKEQENGYSRYFDIDKAFSDRLESLIYSYTDYTSFCEKIKTRNITHSRVARNLLHILLDIYQSDVDAFCADDYVYYARIVGFRKEAAPLLSAIKEKTSIPLISKLADSDSYVTSENGRKMLKRDIESNHIYSLIVSHKYHHNLLNEYKRAIVIL
ncbi:MAG: nucleotidyltransferase [Lachnospiraceae bacterium]|nr:nucleotidyltransferase [Lachnospiraceae bacterium]